MKSFGEDPAGSPLRRLLLVGVSGALFALPFPPFGLHPVGWIALAPAFAAFARASVMGAFALGTGFSLVVGLATSYWLPAMLSNFFGLGRGEAWLAAATATLATGFWYGVCGAWMSLLARRDGLGPLPAALVFGACELARTQGPLANPWMLSGYGQAESIALVQIADVGGVVAIGMVLAAVNALFAGWFEPLWQSPRSTWLATAAVVLAVLAYGGIRLNQEFREGDPVGIALVQSAIPRERRGVPGLRDANLVHQQDLIRHAASSRPDLVILAELALDAPLGPLVPETPVLGAAAAEGGAQLLIGAPYVESGAPTRHAFNSFHLIDGARALARYDKVALAPFSETRPLTPWIEMGIDAFRPGTSRKPLDTRGGRLGVVLCSEGMLGEFARESVLQGAELLANPSNDSWFANEGAARAQLSIATLRAVETRRFLLRPTFTGHTAVADAHGRITAVAAFGRPDVLVAAAWRSSARTFYVEQGDAVGWAAVAGASLWTLWVHRRKNARDRI